MSISRSDLAIYLNEQFSSLAAAVAQDVVPATGYKPDIDNALRKLGVAEGNLAAATVTDGSRDSYFALAEYYAARRFWRLLMDRVNHTMGETTYNFTNQMNQAKAMMDDAAKQCAALGISVSTDGWTIGYLNLDYLEPELPA